MDTPQPVAEPLRTSLRSPRLASLVAPSRGAEVVLPHEGRFSYDNDCHGYPQGTATTGDVQPPCHAGRPGRESGRTFAQVPCLARRRERRPRSPPRAAAGVTTLAGPATRPWAGPSEPARMSAWAWESGSASVSESVSVWSRGSAWPRGSSPRSSRSLPTHPSTAPRARDSPAGVPPNAAARQRSSRSRRRRGRRSAGVRAAALAAPRSAGPSPHGDRGRRPSRPSPLRAQRRHPPRRARRRDPRPSSPRPAPGPWWQVHPRAHPASRRRTGTARHVPFWRARSTSASTAGDTAAVSDDGAGGSAGNCWKATSARDAPTNGGAPVSMAKSRQPSA
jgi:hypothetical protein